MYDVVSIGELLIDLTPHGQSDKGNQLYEANPGGAPANYLAVLAKLGHKTAFIGKVGDDEFGHLLIDTLKTQGISASGVIQSVSENTTLVFVHLDESGERSFSFYRKPGADMMLVEEEVPYDLIESARFFNFGGVSLSQRPARNATLAAAAFAKDKGMTITYDPNLRPLIWDNLEEARRVLLQGMEYADIVKISDDELVFLLGEQDLSKAAKELQERYGIKLLLVSMGAKGCFFRFGDKEEYVAGFKVSPVDTTGAGDAFFGAFISRVLEANTPLSDLQSQQIAEYARFANQVGALVTTKKGALKSMPSLSEIKEFGKDL